MTKIPTKQKSASLKHRLLLLLLLASSCFTILPSCSSARVYQTTGSSASAGVISDVQVVVKAGALDADNESDYRTYSVSGSLREALIEELQRKKKFGAQGATIEFTVTDFRMRSGSAVFWVGVMAGSDRLAGTATVKNGVTIFKTFEAGAKGNESAWSGMALGRISAGSRADVFCRKIARDIVKQL